MLPCAGLRLDCRGKEGRGETTGDDVTSRGGTRDGCAPLLHPPCVCACVMWIICVTLVVKDLEHIQKLVSTS
jgi:hypothetical protein